MIKYSILVPVYNAEAFIKKCLDSIKNQTYRDFEVVCLDDGSTDSSGDILDNYAKQDNRFKVFHVDNGGIANGRNRLLQLANGEYVYYMDSDDWLELDFFEKADVAINCHKSDIYLFDVFRDNGNTCKYMKACQYEKTTHFSDLKNTEVFENYFMRPYRTVWNKIVSRKMLIDNKFEFVDLFCADDVLYSLKIYLYAKSITYVALAGYHYYYNSYSISQKYQGDKVIKMMKSLYYEEMKLIESFSYLDIISYLNTSLINSLPMIANQYVFHKANGLSSKQQNMLMKELWASEPFSGALLKYNKRFVGKSAKLMLLTGKPSIVSTRFMCWLKQHT